VSTRIQNLLFFINGLIRGFYLGSAERPCKIAPFSEFCGKTRNINIGHSTIVYAKAHFHCDKGSRIIIGSNCEIHAFSRIMTYGGNIEVRNYCSINPYSILYGHGGLRIGSRVRIAAHVVIVPGSHCIKPSAIPIMSLGVIKLPIVIQDNVWIGAGAKVLGGVTIHKGAVIGANAVVTWDIPENAIVAGVPARIIRFRDFAPDELMDKEVR